MCLDNFFTSVETSSEDLEAFLAADFLLDFFEEGFLAAFSDYSKLSPIESAEFCSTESSCSIDASVEATFELV
jgi:hypothetical protein